MLRALLVQAAFVAACSSPAKPTASPAPSNAATPATGSDANVGNHGAVCGLGGRHKPGDDITPVECTAGLQCCYPCGIDGCDDICMTPDECRMDRP